MSNNWKVPQQSLPQTIRGGSEYFTSKYCRSTDRHAREPGYCDIYLGMRCCTSNMQSVSRVLRGGGWFKDSEGVRSAFRGLDEPAGRFANYGFRLACTNITNNQR